MDCDTGSTTLTNTYGISGDAEVVSRGTKSHKKTGHHRQYRNVSGGYSATGVTILGTPPALSKIDEETRDNQKQAF